MAFLARDAQVLDGGWKHWVAGANAVATGSPREIAPSAPLWKYERAVILPYTGTDTLLLLLREQEQAREQASCGEHSRLTTGPCLCVYADGPSLTSAIAPCGALVDLAAVQQGLTDGATQFVDTRSAAEYNGRNANGNARTGAFAFV